MQRPLTIRCGCGRDHDSEGGSPIDCSGKIGQIRVLSPLPLNLPSAAVALAAAAMAVALPMPPTAVTLPAPPARASAVALAAALAVALTVALAPATSWTATRLGISAAAGLTDSAASSWPGSDPAALCHQ